MRNSGVQHHLNVFVCLDGEGMVACVRMVGEGEGLRMHVCLYMIIHSSVGWNYKVHHGQQREDAVQLTYLRFSPFMEGAHSR